MTEKEILEGDIFFIDNLVWFLRKKIESIEDEESLLAYRNALTKCHKKKDALIEKINLSMGK